MVANLALCVRGKRLVTCDGRPAALRLGYAIAAYRLLYDYTLVPVYICDYRKSKYVREGSDARGVVLFVGMGKEHSQGEQHFCATKAMQ